MNNIAPNYKSPKRYSTAKYPLRQCFFLTSLIHLLSKIALIGKKRTVEKINMEGLKPPYMVLSNHMDFIDFELVSHVTYPHRVNNVVNVDGFYKRAWLLELIGAIGTRKFATDIHLVRSIMKVFERGDVLCMYPEACYSPCGVQSYLPPALGMLIKKAKVPVVTVVHKGNHLHSPFWNITKKKNVPLHTTATKILTPEMIESMSIDEINALVRASLDYDEYKYQRKNNILITEPYRAEGLHKVLYQCPHCKKEHKMASKGTEIFCTECGKRWTWQENGYLVANDGITEFEHIPDWFIWQKEQVRDQIEKGEYSFEDDVTVHSLPRCNSFVALGNARLTHDQENGFTLTGNYRNQDYYINRKPIQSYNLHVEYSYPKIKGKMDGIVLSLEDDLFYCFPKKENVITKLAFATQILYEKTASKTKARTRAN